MSYLIYNEFGELIDVLVFDSPEELESYKKLHPQFLVENIEVDVPVNYEFDDNEDDYENDGIYEDDLW